MRSPSHRAIAYSIVAATAILGLTSHIPKRATYTGDEPRYLVYALSFNVAGKPLMSRESYEEFHARPGRAIRVASYPLNSIHDTNVPKHAIAVSLLVAPFARSWPVQTIRLIPLAAGLLGLCFLGELLVSLKLSRWAVAGCLVPAALFLPAFPYFFMTLPEIFLFLLVSVAFWNLLTVRAETLREFWPALLCGLLAPFFHLRGVALALAVACYAAWHLGWRRPGARIAWRPLVQIALIYAIVGALSILYNYAIYGHIFGSVTTARPKFSFATFTALLFNFRHGLLTFAPIYILSFAGLIAGFWQRKDWAAPAAIFLAGVVAVSVGPDPGESYPARFWVQAVPVLVICLVGFMQGRLAAWAKAALYAILGSLCAANTIFFVYSPETYIAGRGAALPYDRMFELFPWIHFGFWVNLLDISTYRLPAFVFLSLSIVAIALPLIKRSRSLTGIALFVVLAGFELHRARPVALKSDITPQLAVLDIGDAHLANRSLIWLELWAPQTGDRAPIRIIVSDGANTLDEAIKTAVVLRPRRPWAMPLQLRVRTKGGEAVGVDPNALRLAVSTSWLAKAW